MTQTSGLHMSRGGRRWLLGTALAFMAGMASLVFVLLALATDHRSFQQRNYASLLWLNVGVAAVLGLALLWLAVRLLLRLKHKRFGSHLLLKIAAIFGLVGLLPGVFIYTVSYQFVSRSIETWFDVRVEHALTAGLNLGRTTLDTLRLDLGNKTRAAATGLANSNGVSAVLALERLREQLVASDAVLWGADGRALVSAGESRYRLAPQRPNPSQLRQAREERFVTWIEGLEELEGQAEVVDVRRLPVERLPVVRALAWVPPSSFGFDAGARYVQVSAPLPAALVADALAVQLANREYQERALGREGLRSMYIGTLTLALFLTVFGAVLLAVLLGTQLVRPLLVLAEGMRDVAKGDLTPKLALPARDELAGLTRTFAHMTQELDEARQAVQQSMSQVDTARANLQTLLDNLTTGVVVLDTQQRILSANPGAAHLLHVPLSDYLGHPLSALPANAAFGQWVQQQFETFLSASAQGDAGHHWQQSFEWPTTGSGVDVHGATLIARGARLPNGELLLVFDDVSDIISAQRAQAWGEVARRLAHEIKNPLTPIQLSAERLEMKLSGKLEGAELGLLHKSVRTIVDQVDAMKRLVNEFRDYARLPAAQMQAVDLNHLVSGIVALYEASEVPVRLDLAPDCPLVWADPQQVRQVVHNVVQNAQDATPVGGGAVRLSSRLSDSGQWVRLLVQDQGPGFADAILKRAFEPYVTSKTKGTGLGLAVVKKIMDEHGGRVDISHRMEEGQVRGAQVSLSFRVANVQQS